MIRPENVPLGYYAAYSSPIHRASVGAKFFVLAAFLLSSAIWAKSLFAAGLCLVVVACAYLAAKIPPSLAFRQLLGPLPISLMFAFLLWWRTNLMQAATTFIILLSAIAAAILFTLTTRVSEVLDAVTRWLGPLARLGVPVETVALALSLTIRMVPLQAQAISQVLEACKARGAGNSITAFGVPVIVCTIKRSRAIADALIARGFSD